MNRSDPVERRKVLFLCTGNSCRSQMAEAITNARLGDAWEASSAGTEPARYVHPFALRVLSEIGIQHQGFSKNVSEFKGTYFDVVVTLCDSAAEECPLWLGPGRRIHIGYPDPAKAEGNEEDVLEQFRLVRDLIAEEIPAYLVEELKLN